MDPVKNPFAPGAGSPPPELAGRDALREHVRVAFERTRRRRPAKNVLMVGLRGVGKTVLLDRMRDDAEQTGLHTVRMEAHEDRSLPAMLAPELRKALLRLSRIKRAAALSQRALRALAGFVTSLKMKYQDIEVGFDFEPEQGLADDGDLESSLNALFDAVGEAAASAGTALIVCLDELHYVKSGEVAALVTTLHRMAQRQWPVLLLGAGLPHLRVLIGKAKTYSERLFDFPEIGPLSSEDAAMAISKPAFALSVKVNQNALARIVHETQGYPYFVQEWGKQSWDAAKASPITVRDVESAAAIAVAALDDGFFRVRFERLTPKEKRYLRAMAELGQGPYRSGEIADVLGDRVTALAPLRQKLIVKGMVYSPAHGDTAFTVPLFDDFMRRIMPGQRWRAI